MGGVQQLIPSWHDTYDNSSQRVDMILRTTACLSSTSLHRRYLLRKTKQKHLCQNNKNKRPCGTTFFCAAKCRTYSSLGRHSSLDIISMDAYKHTPFEGVMQTLFVRIFLYLLSMQHSAISVPWSAASELATTDNKLIGTHRVCWYHFNFDISCHIRAETNVAAKAAEA